MSGKIICRKDSDIELADRDVNPTRGFAKVAAKINSDSDKTTALYRRFDELSARNLLFYQAELAELEDELKQLDDEDRVTGDEPSIACQRDWKSFTDSAYGTNGVVETREKQKMELAMKIRDNLEKYHSTLAAHQVLLNSPPRSKSTITALRNWFFNDTKGTKDRAPELWDASSQIYSTPHDLVALRVPADQDRFSSFIHHNLGFLFQTTSSDGRTAYTSETDISRFVAMLSTILAAVLLFGSMISLYVVKSEKALLGMLGSWTVLFAACVGFLTNAKRDQVFGATAAYAVVLVVFISGNLGSSGASDMRGLNCTCSVT